MKFRAKVMNEMRKYKIAQKSHLVRQAKFEVQRTSLRAEELYQFHRLVSSYLAQSVIQTFQKQKDIIVNEPMEEIITEQPKQNPIKKHQDDIFVDGDDYSYIPEENNLLDDLLQDPIAEKQEELIEKAEIFIEPISTYIQNKYKECKDSIDQEPILSISRKASLKKINENVRKRLKIKEEEEEQPGRSLSSATVFLSNLLNTEAQSKCSTLVQLPSKTEWLFSSEKQRKKKEQQSFNLNWSSQEIQKMEKRNQKFNYRKGKIDNSALALYMNEQEQQFKKYFEKNISSEKSFPPTLKNVRQFEVTSPKRYYNQFHDREYEMFIMNFNKRKVFERFAEMSSMIFPENYSHDDIEANEPINAGKIFVHPPSKVLDRIIYRVIDYKLEVAIKSDLSSVNMDLNHMVILTFFAKKYLSKFGNRWQIITQFISMHPIFANHYITEQLVQEVYQLIIKYEHQDKKKEIQLWDKKILPFNYYNCQSYTEFDPKAHSNEIQPNGVSESMVDEGEKSEQSETFDISRYEEMIKEKVEQPKADMYGDIGQQFQQFVVKIRQNMLRCNVKHTYQAQSPYSRIYKVLGKFKRKTEPIEYMCPDELAKQHDIANTVQELMNTLKINDIKAGYAIRKKKNINERNNQLVKILQALRNKSIPTPVAMQKKPEDAKPASASIPKQTPSAVPPPVQKQTQAAQQKNKIQKSPQKQQKKLGAPSSKAGPQKKDKKTKDDDQKK